MTIKSLEALEELCSRCYVDSEKCSCHARYQGGECYTSCEYKELLEKDLERLNKFEKENQELKDKLNSEALDNWQLHCTYGEYKKTIDILKSNLCIEFNDNYNGVKFKLDKYDECDYTILCLNDKQQYNLLKDIFKNGK